MPTHCKDLGTVRGLRGRRGTLLAAAVGILLAVSGLTAAVIGVASQQTPPTPAAAADASTPSSSGTSSAPNSPALPSSPAQPAPLPPSTPTHLDVPTIGVSSDLVQLGTNPDGTVQVPPLDKDSRAGWYTGSPTPGELGPSIILGHIDSKEYGPGVFFKLGALTTGEQVSVTRADGTVAVFSIDKVAEYPKDQFPTIAVYGNTNDAALRLITCGGKFDYSARSYEDNIVVYAHLTSAHPA